MSDVVNEEILEQLGISRPVYEEVQAIVGHMPTVDEISTLLAMWESNGRQMGLLKWLKGQFHAIERHDYLYEGDDANVRNLHEPKVKECMDIALKLWGNSNPVAATPTFLDAPLNETGLELFMVGDVSTEFLGSDYARKYLHVADNPMEMGSEDEDREYRLMILNAMKENGHILTLDEIAEGGLFFSLLKQTSPGGLGFDIISCREIRLDAFLFGEERGRFLVAIQEHEINLLLQKLSEAGLNCCFLGHTTHGRIVVDGMDFGPVSNYSIN